ncbi:Uncharacterised protein [Vibrio cholerae]|nr:Uncharacterised protein [Vibrio cholerae]
MLGFLIKENSLYTDKRTSKQSCKECSSHGHDGKYQCVCAGSTATS